MQLQARQVGKVLDAGQVILGLWQALKCQLLQCCEAAQELPLLCAAKCCNVVEAQACELRQLRRQADWHPIVTNSGQLEVNQVD